MKVFSIVAGLLLLLCLTGVGQAAEEQAVADNPVPTGTLVGRFTDAGKAPLANGRVYIYDKAVGPPSSDVYVRVPDYITDLDGNGRFTHDLPAGTYYFIARSSADIANFGPPLE